MNSDGPNPATESLAPQEMPHAGSVPHAELENRLVVARWLLVMGGLLAGLTAFGVGEAIYQLIPAERVTFNTMGTMVTATTAATQSVADVLNGMLAFGVLSACLGGFLGIAGGLVRRSAAATVGAALLGSTLGAALTAAISIAILKRCMDAQVAYSDYEIIISMVMHGVIWGLAGAWAGVAFAAGLGRPRLLLRAAAAGLAGAMLGAIAFELVGAGLFPLASTGEPISTTWPSRLAARLLVCIATAAGVILILPGPRPVKSRKPSALP